MAKHKLPKRIAGVKVPKSVRKGGVGKFLGSKAGQALIAEAVMALGAVVAAKKSDTDLAGAGRKSLNKLGQAGKHAGRHTGDAATLNFALAEGVRAFSSALQGGREADPALAPAAPTRVEDEPSKKNPSSYGSAAH